MFSVWPAVFVIGILAIWQAFGLAIVVSLVTLGHTFDETFDPEESIWEFLGVSPWLYFAFQSFVLVAGWLAAWQVTIYEPGIWVVVFLLLRFGDVAYTHLYRGAPGSRSAVCLAADGLWVFAMMVNQ